MPRLVDSTCEYCNEFKAEGWSYCGNCSKAFKKRCFGCPNQIRPGKTKCKWCGAKIEP